VANLELARIQTTRAIRKHGENKKQSKSYLLRLFIFKREFLKTSVDIQTAFAAETHIAEGQ
jgi:hypothetical protein